MPAVRSAAIGVSSEAISGILNCVRPDCGGSMGEPGREFECPGKCSDGLASALGATLIRGIPPSVKKAITLN